MDEPLASLDAPRKAEILPFLTRLKTNLRLPILYVTHALDEVNRLADSIVLIERGHVVGAGALSDIAARTDLPFAQRDDAGALLLCTVAGHDAARELTRLSGGGVTFLVPLLELPIDGKVRVRIPAREITLAGKAPESISMHNMIAGTVRRIAREGARRSAMVEIALPEGALLSRVTPDAIGKLGLVEGGPVLALIKSTAIEVLGA